MNGLEKRTQERKLRIVLGRAHRYEEAEQWDLTYWQTLSPAERLSAHVAILRDVEKVKQSASHNKELE